MRIKNSLATKVLIPAQYSPGNVISVNRIGATLKEAGVDCNLDALIAHWKGFGIISLRLSSLRSVKVNRSPMYEINP